MKFQNIKLKSMIISSGIVFLYPIAKSIANGGSMLAFLDSLSIISLVYIVIGVANILVRHGDFDATVYTLTKKGKTNLSYEEYKEQKKEERENSFNYPLFLGILFFVISYLLGKYFY